MGSWMDSPPPPEALNKKGVSPTSSWMDSPPPPEALASSTKPKSEESFTYPQAIIRKYGEGLSGGLTNVLAAGGQSIIKGTPFKEEMSNIQKESAQIEKQYPGISPAATIGGLLTPGGIMGKVAGSVKGGLTAAKAARPALAGLAGTVLGGAAYETSRKATNPDTYDEDIKKTGQELLNSIALNTGLSVGAQALSSVGPAIKWARTKALQSPGLSAKSIETYAKNPKEVAKIINENMATFLPSYAEKTNDAIKNFVKNSESQIDELIAPHADKLINANPILDQGYNALGNVMRFQSTSLKKESANKIADMIDNFEKVTVPGPNGEKMLRVGDLLQFRRDAQDLAKSYYNQSSIGAKDLAGEAANNIAHATNEVLGSIDPKILNIAKAQKAAIEAQNVLDIGNVFTSQGKVDTGQAQRLLSTLQNPSKVGQLNAAKQLDEIVGTDLSKISEFYKSAQEVGSPDIFSRSSTGRSVLKAATFGKLGSFLESPVIQRGLVSGSESLGNMLEKNPSRIGGGAYEYLQRQYPEAFGGRK